MGWKIVCFGNNVRKRVLDSYCSIFLGRVGILEKGNGFCKYVKARGGNTIKVAPTNL